MAFNTVPARAGPPESFVTITPSDSTLLQGYQYLYVGVTGDVAIKGFADSAAVTLKAVPAGEFIPFGSGYVMSTNTTATDMVGLA